MTYSSGGLIQATDYNNFVGASTSSTSGQLNAVWSTGNGNRGYGQTAISQAAATGGTVTATQWSSMINSLNSIKFHQTGAGSGISAVTAGSTISYLSALSTALTSVHTAGLSFATQGATTTGTVYSPNVTSVNTIAAQSMSFTRTLTFASANAARYFFNAGGQLNFVSTSVTNNDGSARSADLVALAGSYLVNISNIRATTNGGKSGTGGTVNTNNTALGYYSLTTTGQTIASITSATYTYTGDYVTASIRSNGTVGADGDKGNIVYLDFVLYSSARAANQLFNQTLNVTWNHRIDVVYPESTNLTNSWGTVTVT